MGAEGVVESAGAVGHRGVLDERQLLVERLLAVAEKLGRYAARMERQRDSRSIFAHLYAGMTRTLAESLPRRSWDDPGWVVALAETFASRFLAAMDDFDAGRAPSAAWEELQATMRARRTSVLQDLVAGMVGHIVHDLPLALCDVGLAHIADYQQMNDVLGDAIDALKTDVERRYNPWLRGLDWVAGETDDIATNYGIRLSRAAAWYNAARLLDPVAAAGARETLENSPRTVVQELFEPRSLPVRLLVRAVSSAISFGRRWPRPPVPAAPAPIDTPSQRYYFGSGAGRWRGTFRYGITDWRSFRASRLGLADRLLALGMAAAMTVFRKARIDSTIDAFPDQGPRGVATNDVRISLFGLTLYLLTEQYALADDGESVWVRSYERFGPIPALFSREKKHPAKVTENGARATYYIPLLGADWVGEYQVASDGDRIESVLTCSWARATESIERVP